ncbi:MAG: hypothetical protein P8163_21345 [Candidatus Thiodiazotropha sp.]
MRSLTIILKMLGTFAAFGRRHIYPVFAHMMPDSGVSISAVTVWDGLKPLKIR